MEHFVEECLEYFYKFETSVKLMEYGIDEQIGIKN